MKNGKMEKETTMKRMAIAVVCVGMIGSGGLVQAKPVIKPLPKGKITLEMTRMIDVPASKITILPVEIAVQSPSVEKNKRQELYTQPSETEYSINPEGFLNNHKGIRFEYREKKVNLPDFQIGQAEVTWALWSDVYNWATKNGYKFANTGTNVGIDKPVKDISWYDAIVWMNAYSEKSNKVPVYLAGNKSVLKDAENEGAFDNMVLRVVTKGNGYRLPTETEWTIAARFNGTKKPANPALAKLFTKGKDGKTYYWIPENHASGATKNVDDNKETARVAWFGQKSVQKICKKAKNALNICDMSGNVWEWQFTSTDGKERGIRGGSWNNDSSEMDVSYVYGRIPSDNYTGIGFRLARNVP